MRTSLRYQVTREEESNRIQYRSFDFIVTGCKTEAEHNETISSFYNFLKERKITASAYGDNTWEEAKSNKNEASYSYLNITVDDSEDKEYIKGLYNEWKQSK